MTFPALLHYGKPLEPITASWAFHPLIIRELKQF